MQAEKSLPALALILLLLPAAGLAAAQSLRAVSPDRVPWYWELVDSPTELNVPNHGHNLHVPVCASVTYVIGADGVPTQVKLARVEPASDLGPTAIEAVRQFRYQASPENIGQEPIRTWYTAQFNMRNLPPEQKAELVAACDVPGY